MGDGLHDVATSRLDIAYTDEREMACDVRRQVAHKWYCMLALNWLWSRRSVGPWFARKWL